MAAGDIVEFVKEAIRLILYPFMVMCGGEVFALEDTWKYKIMVWLYGEPTGYVVDPWIYPDDWDGGGE